MEEGRKATLIKELQTRLLGLPLWQKKATLECIDILKNKDPKKSIMYINLRNAGHFDLADEIKRLMEKL